MASHDHGIHSCEECVPKGSDYFQETLGRVHTKRSLTHDKRREDGSNWRSSTHDSKKIPQEMRNMKNLLSILIIWIRNDAVMNEEDDEAERRSLPKTTNKDKYSIVISWYCLVVHLFIFSWCVMHVWVFAFILLNYTWWVRSQCCCTTFHYYLSRLKPFCWNIRSSTHS